jgi:hypothetical protein
MTLRQGVRSDANEGNRGNQQLHGGHPLQIISDRTVERTFITATVSIDAKATGGWPLKAVVLS